MSDKYADIDGTPRSLRQLILREPDWAESRIKQAEMYEAEIERLQGVIEAVLHESSGLAGLCETQLRHRLVRICKIAMRERESKEGLNNE